MSKLTKALTAAAGNAGESLYVEDVFSTYLYDGTGAAHTITNGIDLDGEGGLTWIKTRNTGTSAWHSLSDTERGAGYILRSDLTNAQNFDTAEFTSFNSDGFTVGNDAQTNGSGRTYASWSFRKAKKFFDVVTYTGNSTVGRTVAHNLGVAPAWMVIKCTNAARNWCTYHISLGNGYQIILNNGVTKESTALWNSTTPTATEFTLGNDADVNGTGNSYVAYLFASDAGGFGDDGSENIIKCGSYTGNGSADGPTINCGFEPQWLLIKNTSDGGNWVLMDAMRGMPVGDEATVLLPNTNGDESGYANLWGVDLQATGFKVNVSQIQINESGGTMIYIAIRRPMKTPESGTDVFYVDTVAASSSSSTGFDPDMWIRGSRDGSGGTNSQLNMARLIDNKYLATTQTSSEIGTAAPFGDGPSNQFTNTVQGGSGVNWFFRRATGFMDVVAYDGNSTIRQQSHNLGVTPEFLIVKGRNFASHWYTYHTGQTGGVDALHSYMRLNLTEASQDGQSWKNYNFNASTFSLDADNAVNGSTYTYVAYLFATLAGVSKVGKYIGTGADLNVDCGFSAGARFILIKRSDSTGDWYVWDSSRGISASTDPYLLLNTTAAEVTNTDYIDPLSSGFTVTSSAPAALNASGGTYIFLAIA